MREMLGVLGFPRGEKAPLYVGRVDDDLSLFQDDTPGPSFGLFSLANPLDGPGPLVYAGARVRGFNYDGGSIAGIFDFTVGSTMYGANVDAEDIEDDTFAEIVVGTGYAPTNGAASVRGYNYDGAAIAAISTLNFTAYSGTQYGVNVAVDEVGP